MSGPDIHTPSFHPNPVLGKASRRIQIDTSNSIPTTHELLVTTSHGVSRWKADGTVVQSFYSKDAGLVAATAIPSRNGRFDQEMLALADSHIILLAFLGDGAVQEKYGLQASEGSIRLLVYAPATRVLFFTTSLDHVVRAYSIDQGCLLDGLDHAHPSPPLTLAVSPDACTLVTCSAVPPIIHLQSLTTNASPDVLWPSISDAAVVAAAFHPDRPDVLALAFTDGSLAAYDTKRLIALSEDGVYSTSPRREIRSEMGYIRGLHAIVGGPFQAVESIAFVSGFHWRLVSVGGDGQCCVVYLCRKGGVGGKVVKRWHIGGAATSLAVVVPGSRDVQRTEEAPHAGEGKGRCDDAILAIGREDGEVAIYDLRGNKKGRHAFCSNGTKVLSVEWRASGEDNEVKSAKKRSSSTRLGIHHYMARSHSPRNDNNAAQVEINSTVSQCGREALRSISFGDSLDVGEDVGHKSPRTKVTVTPALTSSAVGEMKRDKSSNRFSLESNSAISTATPTPRFTLLGPTGNKKATRSPKPTRPIVVHKRSKRTARMPPSSKTTSVDEALDNLSLQASRRAIASLHARMGDDSAFSCAPYPPSQDDEGTVKHSQERTPAHRDLMEAEWEDSPPLQSLHPVPTLQQRSNYAAKRQPGPLSSVSPLESQHHDPKPLDPVPTSNDTVVSWIAAYHKPHQTGLRSRNAPRWDPPNSSQPPSSSASSKPDRPAPRTPSPPSTSNSTILDWGTSGLLRNPRISPFHRETRIPSKINHTPRDDKTVTPATVKAWPKTLDDAGQTPVQLVSHHPTPKLPPLSPSDPHSPSARSNGSPWAAYEINGRDYMSRPQNDAATLLPPAISFPAPVHAHLDAMESRLHSEIQDLRRDMHTRLNTHRRELAEEGRRQEGGLRKLLEENGELRKELWKVEKRAKGAGKRKGRMDCLWG